MLLNPVLFSKTFLLTVFKSPAFHVLVLETQAGYLPATHRVVILCFLVFC